MPDEAENSQDASIDEILAEYLRKVDSGEDFDREAFIKAHPEAAEELSELLDTADIVDDMAGPLSTDTHFPAASLLDLPNDETGAWSSSTIGVSGAGRGDMLSFDVRDLPNIRDTANLEAHVFGDYELLEVIGRGGMGVVYKAREISMNRVVAVKMINSGKLASETDIQRFQKEAQAAGQLEHSNIVTVYQIGQQDGYHFYSMDYIEGTDLAEKIKDDTLDADDAAKCLQVVAEAVHFAHENGILHRDLKPANVVIDDSGRPVITDFGLAKYVENDAGLTSTGAALGTPSYMPPEQASAKHHLMGPTSDIYSLGGILYALLTGSSPFRGETLVETISDVLHKDPEPPTNVNADVPKDLETICLKCLEKDPKDRYRTAKDLADDLDRYLRREPIVARGQSTVTKITNWLRHVPLIAAVIGRTTSRPNTAQRRLHACMLALPFVAIAGFGAWHFMPERMPSQVRIATAAEGGAYEAFGNVYADVLQGEGVQAVSILKTEGSVQNGQMLLDGAAEVALMQGDAIASDRLAVVAPLYHDVVHIVVRKQSQITTLDDLVGKRIATGAPMSGMQRSAHKLLLISKLAPNKVQETSNHFTTMLEDDAIDAAIITTSPRNKDLHRLLADDRFTLMGLEDDIAEELSLSVPWFHRIGVKAKSYARATAPSEPINTIATSSFLVVRDDAANRFVGVLLDSLYKDANFTNEFNIFSQDKVAGWLGYAFHPEASRYFRELETEAGE